MALPQAEAAMVATLRALSDDALRQLYCEITAGPADPSLAALSTPELVARFREL
jgi:hypothetical protein